MHARLLVGLMLLAPLAATAGCRSMYYGTMEAFGVHKREILVDRVEEGRAAQEKAKKEFQSALEAFRSVADFDGGDLEKVYDKLNGRYESCADRAEAVRAKVKSIDTVSRDLFSEWESELRDMKDAKLRARSEEMLEDTRTRCKGLVRAMRAAEEKMEPVLSAFKDHVTFLKHNLNARAIASLQGELAGIQGDVAELVRDMEKSIAEADAFIESMDGKAAK